MEIRDASFSLYRKHSSVPLALKTFLYRTGSRSSISVPRTTRWHCIDALSQGYSRMRDRDRQPRKQPPFCWRAASSTSYKPDVPLGLLVHSEDPSVVEHTTVQAESRTAHHQKMAHERGLANATMPYLMKAFSVRAYGMAGRSWRPIPESAIEAFPYSQGKRGSLAAGFSACLLQVCPSSLLITTTLVLASTVAGREKAHCDAFELYLERLRQSWRGKR
jgi:hypothetical protein